jgi:arylsulfatase A-like enzyme
MERRDFLKVIGAGTVLAMTSDWTEAVGKKRPNIILCMSDDQGWGEVGYYGHPVIKTPCLDEMAKNSLRFDRFYAAFPVCSPTRVSVLTGRHPNRMGCFCWGWPIRPQEQTIAQILKNAGYRTGHFGKWHVGSVIKESPVSPGACGFDEWLSAYANYPNINPTMSRNGKAVQIEGESSMVTMDAALEFIKKNAKTKQPFLAVVWFGSPHQPHEASEEDKKLYADQKEAYKNYCGEITGMDKAMGKLRTQLRQMGIADNTVLWFCSDNGGLVIKGAKVNTGGRGHKGTPYEGGLRVPAILEWPEKIKPGQITNVPCVTSDILPTVCDIAGAKPLKDRPLDGINLSGLIAGKMKTRPKPIGFWRYYVQGIPMETENWIDMLKAEDKPKEENPYMNDPNRLLSDSDKIKEMFTDGTYPGHSGWLDWPLKLHRIQDQKTGVVKKELYNLETDPMERKNIIEQHKERAAAMEKEMLKWLDSVIKSYNGRDYNCKSSQSPPEI